MVGNILGACVEPGNIAVLSEVCPRGSLMVGYIPWCMCRAW